MEWVDQRGNRYRDAGINIEVTEPIVLVAKWRDDYTLLVLLMVAIVMSVAMIYLVMRAAPHRPRVVGLREVIPPERGLPPEILEEIEQLRAYREKIISLREKEYIEDEAYRRIVESYNERVSRLREKLKKYNVDIESLGIKEL